MNHSRLRLPLLTALLLAPAAPAEELQPAARSNVIIILADDMGYGDLSCHGATRIHTPNIDKLAGRGTIHKSLCAQPLCSPTRAALLSDRFSTHTGVYHVITPGATWGLPLNERTLPEALAEVGYTTAICGKWRLGESSPKYRPSQRGFQHQYGHMMGNLDYFTHIRNKKLDGYRDDKPLEEEGYTTQLIAKESCRLIRSQPTHKPLFLYIPFNTVHTSYQLPDRT